MLEAMVLEGKAFGRCFSQEGGILMKWMGFVPIKEAAATLAPSPRQEVCSRKKPSPGHVGTLLSNYGPLRNTNLFPSSVAFFKVMKMLQNVCLFSGCRSYVQTGTSKDLFSNLIPWHIFWTNFSNAISFNKFFFSFLHWNQAKIESLKSTAQEVW